MKRYNVLVCAVTFFESSCGEEQVLVLRRSLREKFLPGVWGLPCGKLEVNEDLESAALRELREEAGIPGTVEHLAGSSWFQSVYQGVRLDNLQVNFAVRALSRQVSLDASVDKYEWINTSDIHDAPVALDDFTLRAIDQAVNLRAHL
jgi:8-oxo-dGTP diphosphatase